MSRLQRIAELARLEHYGKITPEQSAALAELRARAQQQGQTLSKFIEPMLTVGSAMVAEPVSGFVGLGALPLGADVAASAVDRTQKAMTYQPRTESGREGLEAVSNALQPIGAAFEGASSYLGDAAFNATGSPAAGAAAYSIPTLGAELLGLKGAGRIPGRQFDIGDIGPGSRQRGMFAGINARNADTDALRKAQDMAESGANRDEIWNETGWFKDVDGSWKFEIDDSGARTRDIFKSDPMAREILEEADEVSTDLPYALSHKNLKAAYPDDFADTEVVSKPYAQSEGGRYSLGTITTPTDFRFGDDAFKVDKPTLLHELQHGIQSREGFAEGGSPTGPFRAGEMDQLIQATVRDMQKLKGNAGESYEKLYEHARRLVNSNDGRRKAYNLLAGEAEARNVETRMNMNPSERRATPPWRTLDVPEDDLIVRRDRTDQ